MSAPRVVVNTDEVPPHNIVEHLCGLLGGPDGDMQMLIRNLRGILDVTNRRTKACKTCAWVEPEQQQAGWRVCSRCRGALCIACVLEAGGSAATPDAALFCDKCAA